MKYPRAPTSPPTSAAKAISYAQSAGLPSSLNRRAASAPMAMNARAKARPNVFSVIGPMSRLGSIEKQASWQPYREPRGIDVGSELPTAAAGVEVFRGHAARYRRYR